MGDISYLQISTKICSENCQGLFDFSSFKFDKKSWKITKPCNIYFNDNKCFIPSGEEQNGSVGLISISKSHENFCACVLEDGEKVWRIVRECRKTPNGFRLNEGDLIKIGKVLLLVKVYGAGNDHVNSTIIQDFYEDKEEDGRVIKPLEENAEDVCRICLNEANTEENPLLSPCKCSGTMKAIHKQCLQRWVLSKVESRVSTNITSFIKQDICCELCHERFPTKLIHKDKESLLINFLFSSTENFIALEEFAVDKPEKLAMHILNIPENDKISIGRSVWSDLKLKDISVSRNHCKIKNIGSEFFLIDQKSKYGTLVEVKSEVKIKDYELHLQVGRAVLKITQKKSCRLWACCKKNNKVDCEARAARTLNEVNDGTTEVAGFIQNC